MLAYVKGTVELCNEDSVVLENNGLGYLIKTSKNVINRLPVDNSIVTLYTYMYLRADEISLYGFLTQDELRIFTLLIGVSGVGPKVATSVLSTLTVDELRIAVLSEDTKTISKANGIGAKGAQRIIIDLRDKLKIDSMDMVSSSQESNYVSGGDIINEVILALASMGFSNSEAMKAIKKVNGYEEMQVEELLKASLKCIM